MFVILSSTAPHKNPHNVFLIVSNPTKWQKHDTVFVVADKNKTEIIQYAAMYVYTQNTCIYTYFDGTHGHSASCVVFSEPQSGEEIYKQWSNCSCVLHVKPLKNGFFIPLWSFSSILASSF